MPIGMMTSHPFIPLSLPQNFKADGVLKKLMGHLELDFGKASEEVLGEFFHFSTYACGQRWFEDKVLA